MFGGNLKLPARAKFWRKRCSADLTDLDPSCRAVYLGNVLTGWAKGDGCMDKPLATLWKNHVGTDKPSIVMKVTVCPSGLKAVTKEHGLTEYWANRITCCASDPAYPRVFCWIYRHEGRKLKQELRCHAVLCPSSSKAKVMAERLRQRLHQALVDFKKEKLWRQNARLSLANSVYDNPTMPHRKMLLQTGSQNYRPPLERGRAAPKLKVIEEAVVEEDEEQPPEPRPEFSNDVRLFGGSTCDSASIASTASSTVIEPSSDEAVSTEPLPRAAAKKGTTSFVDESDDEEEEEEEDLIINYLQKASCREEAMPSSEAKREIADEDDDVVRRRSSKSEQDTISDESGYSEDSSATTTTTSGACNCPPTVVYIDNKNGDDEEEPLPDPTVRGVLVSEFTESERLRYLERSRQPPSGFLHDEAPDFCINI